MKKIGLLVFAMAALMVVAGCTENQRAKQFGGTAKITLPAGQHLEMVTWKGDNLWCLTRAAKNGEVPTTYTLKEESSFGMVEGKVVIVEQ